MRTLFPGYYRPDDDALEKLWRDACFIFDTNVLLEAYALPETAREEFLSVLEKISDRIWIPYQVALEFHRRRFTKIKDTSKGIAEMRETGKTNLSRIVVGINKLDFDKWNTGIQNLPAILSQLEEVYLKLDGALEAVERKLPSVSLVDPIAAKISDLFTDRVGEPPGNQKNLDELLKDAPHRYASKIPPGYSDAKKGDTYADKNVVYEAKYGDLVMWRQMIAHSKAAGLTHVIFVTADVKEDWWYSEKSGERLGPQPSLVQEFLKETTAAGFWMYTPDRFLETARTRLNVTVADKTVEQVKQSAEEPLESWRELFEADVSQGMSSLHLSSPSFQSLEFEAKQNLRRWVASRHPEAILSTGYGIDIAVEQDHQLTDAYHVLTVRRLGLLGPKLATIQHFPGTRHHSIVVVERSVTRKLALDENVAQAEYRDIMERCGVISLAFFEIADSGMNFLGEIRLR